MLRFVNDNTNVGIVAIIASATAPAIVILFKTLLNYSAVGLPGLIPGINPPFSLRVFEYSNGLNCTAV